MKKENKLIIGVSIILCTIILIVGVTIAYFTQSTSKEMDTIVSNDQLLLEYKDDLNNYMRGDLIPSSKENAIIAYNREGENKCIDDYGYSACSTYRFSIKNISNVSQSLIMTLNPTANSFNNLKFMLYEITEEGNNLIQDATDLIKENYEPIPLYKTYDLDDNKTRIFELVFYIEAKDEDQTVADSGKRFGAGIRINSVTTGKYIVKNFGSNCWDLDETNPQKLVKFNGINHDTGEIDEMCTGYVSQDEDGYYSVTVPSNVGGQEVKTLGNSVLYPIDLENFSSNDLMAVMTSKHYFIKELTIEEGITTISDGIDLGEVPQLGNLRLGILSYGGVNVTTGQPLNMEGVKINLPTSLKYIGKNSFNQTLIKTIDFPNGLEYIMDRAFANNAFMTEVEIPSSVIEINYGAFLTAYDVNNITTILFEDTIENPSKLKMIGERAFNSSKISTLIIPSSVETIEDGAFYNSQLTTLTFAGSEDGTSKLKTIGDSAFYDASITTLTIPSSVEEIQGSAFKRNYNLTSLTFVGAEDGTSKLKTIGDSAFDDAGITTLIIPASVETIEDGAFFSNSYLTSVKFMGAEDGINKLKMIGESAFKFNVNLISIIIPASVESIGSSAFLGNDNLTKVTFMGALDGTSKLKILGGYVFDGCDLTYETSENPLILPNSITNMEKSIFDSNLHYDGNAKLKYIFFTGDTSGFPSDWNYGATVITQFPNINNHLNVVR